MAMIITYLVALAFALAFIAWLNTKNGKKWLKSF